jgi:hypothetical protein
MKKLLPIVTLMIIMSSILSAGIPTTRSENAVTTVILIRHAERDPGADPPLNKKGELRAQSMINTFSEAGITAVYTPDLLRNRQTAEPLLKAIDVQLDLIPNRMLRETKKLAKYFVDEVFSKHKGGVVLYIGNQKSSIKGQMGNLQEVYWALGGEGMPMTRYPDMYIFTIFPDKSIRIIKAEHGGD